MPGFHSQLIEFFDVFRLVPLRRRFSTRFKNLVYMVYKNRHDGVNGLMAITALFLQPSEGFYHRLHSKSNLVLNNHVKSGMNHRSWQRDSAVSMKLLSKFDPSILGKFQPGHRIRRNTGIIFFQRSPLAPDFT